MINNNKNDESMISNQMVNHNSVNNVQFEGIRAEEFKRTVSYEEIDRMVTEIETANGKTC